jgi:hypothetical protein
MHHIQDLIFTVGSLIFVVALVPSLRSPHNKPALSTSVVTGIVLAVFALTYATLALWFSTIATALTSVMWLTLAFQKYRQLKIKQ